MPPRLPTSAAVAAFLLAAGVASPQTAHSGATGQHGQHPHPPAAAPVAGRLPTLPGEDAFGAVQVNLDGLRGHLVDMNEVTLRADAAVRRVEGGIEVTVTGEGRTLAAIRRMVPAHAREIDGRDGWRGGTAELPNGVTLTVTPADPRSSGASASSG